MRILQVTGFFLPSVAGIEVYVLNLSLNLAKFGHEVDILTINTNNAVTEEKLAPNLNVYRCHLNFKYHKGLVSFEFIKKLFQANNYDIYHVHAPFHLGHEATVVASKFLRRKPIVVTVHMYRHTNWFVSRLYDNFVYDTCLQMSDIILPTTRSYIEKEKVFTRLAHKLGVVPIGIDTSHFYPRRTKANMKRELGFNENASLVLFVGSLEPRHAYKRVDDLLRAFSQVSERLDAYLVIVGQGQLIQNLQQLSSVLDLENRVYFKENVSNDELPKYYSAADVFVLPSISRMEAFGIVLLEAMACETPVIAADIPGVQEVAKNGGVTFQPGNIGDLAAKLSSMLRNEESRLQLGKQGREKVLDNYSWEKASKRISEIYTEVVANT